MTKKHFIGIAKAIQDYRLNGCSIYHLGHLANAIADVCQKANPAFDRDKFLDLALRTDIE